MSKVEIPTASAQLPADGAADKLPLRSIQHSEFRLEVVHLRKGFQSPVGTRISVLEDISFTAEPGKTLAITGASGAGKSTLLNLLGGLEIPDDGKIRLGQVSLDARNRRALAHFRNRRIGFVFQFHHLLPDLSAAENVALPLMVGRVRQSEAISRAIKALEEAGIGARADDLVGHLSGGEQQRVSVCRALITRPNLVLADEPTGNVDSVIAESLGKSLLNYARTQPAIVILATHNEQLAKLCDRVLLLRNGILSHSW